MSVLFFASAQARFTEFEVQDAAAFQPDALFEMIHTTTGLFTWRVPLPMHLLLGTLLPEGFTVYLACALALLDAYSKALEP